MEIWDNPDIFTQCLEKWALETNLIYTSLGVPFVISNLQLFCGNYTQNVWSY